MAFCTNCGQELEEGTKFCAECGKATNKNNQTNEQRKTVYDGEVHKCPNCGDVLDAFESVCETCGYEIRNSKTSNAVREFSLKLEAIETSRPIQSASFKKVLANQHQISETDQRKINLIRSFAIFQPPPTVLWYWENCTTSKAELSTNAWQSTAAHPIARPEKIQWNSIVMVLPLFLPQVWKLCY